MEKFTASNGATVEEIETGSDGTRLLVWAPYPYNDVERSGGSTTAYLIDDQRDALREFFQAERDAELGRWRHPELTDFVVYPDEDDMNTIRVMFEPGGGISDYKREWIDGVTDPDGWNIARVVRDYFDAHPVRKPWENAKPGEVWLLDLTASGESAWFVNGDYFQDTKTLANRHKGDKSFRAGRRIWPEGETTT